MSLRRGKVVIEGLARCLLGVFADVGCQWGHQQDDILLEVLDIALLALLVANFSRLELVTYIAVEP